METKRLATKEGLKISRIDTSGSLSKMEKRASWLAKNLSQGKSVFLYPNTDKQQPPLPRYLVGLSFRNRGRLRKVGD